MGTLALTNTTSANQPAIKEACIADITSLGYKSPFKSTSSQCIGPDQSLGTTFYQFAVTVPIGNSSVSIEAKNGNGDTIPFVKESDTLYVSKPTETIGYRGSVHPSTTTPCNDKDGFNIITITAKGSGGKSQSLSANLCENRTTYVITRNATELTTSSTPKPAVGCISGVLGVYRDSEDVNWSTEQRISLAQKKAVSSVKISGTTNLELKNSPEVNNAAWFTLEDGKLRINDLKPGTYTVEIHYNDKIRVNEEISQGADMWTSSDIVFNSGSKIKVTASSTCAAFDENEKDVYISSTTGKQVDDPSGKEKEKEEAPKPSCNIDGVGWMVCPVSSFLGMMLDGAYGAITMFIEVKGKLMNSAEIQRGWGVFRTIANVLFVIAMLYIIYSQMTGLGASNYGIKKIVPKIILGAIAVNLSFIICQLLVDTSNLLGNSIYSIMQEIIPMKQSYAAEFITGILGGGIAIGLAGLTGTALVIAGLGTVLPILLFGLLGVLLTFLILVLRQGGIIILSVIAPLAFVALLLPNTESWFKKWWKMFFGLLLVFPAIALLFGGSRMAAALFSGTDDFVANVFSLGIMTIPLILSPKLLRSSLDATGKLGAGLNSMASRMSGKSTSGLMSGAMKGAKESSIGQGLAAARGFRTRQRSVKWAQRRASGTGGMSKLYNTLGGGGYAEHRAAEGAALENKEDEENVANELTRMKSDMGPSGILAGGDDPNYGNLTAADGGAAYQLQEALKNNDKIKARAATKLLLSQRGKGRAQLKSVIAAHQTAHGGDASKFANNAYENMQAELGGLKASDNVLDQIGYSKKTVGELQSSAGTYNSLTDQELATQAAPDLAYAANNGLISAERAQAMLSNDNLELTQEKRASLQGVVDRAQAQGGGSTPPPTTAQDTNQANPLEGGGTIQHGPTTSQDTTQQANISIPGAGAVSDIHTRREYPNDGMRRVVQRQNRDN